MNKKYKLKPGCHQFAPRSPAIHTNENLSDEEVEWYLEKYPYIAELFVEKLEGCNVATLTENETVQPDHSKTLQHDSSVTTDGTHLPYPGQTTLHPSNIQTLQQTHEDLFTTN